MTNLPFDSSLGLPGGTPLEKALDRWIADARVEGRAEERIRERGLRQQVSEDATLAGTLVDLADRGHPVGVHTTAGRRHQGSVSAVGGDFLLLRSMQGLDVMVPFDAIDLVLPQPGEADAFGERTVTIDVLFAEALHELSHDRPRVLIVFRGTAQTVAGILRSVGRDVVSLGLDGPDRKTAAVHVAAITEVSST